MLKTLAFLPSKTPSTFSQQVIRLISVPTVCSSIIVMHQVIWGSGTLIKFTFWNLNLRNHKHNIVDKEMCMWFIQSLDIGLFISNQLIKWSIKIWINPLSRQRPNYNQELIEEISSYRVLDNQVCIIRGICANIANI